MKLSGPFSYNAFLCTIRTILELGDNVFLTPLAEQMKVAKAYIMVGAVQSEQKDNTWGGTKTTPNIK